jgi:hypothetical protein
VAVQPRGCPHRRRAGREEIAAAMLDAIEAGLDDSRDYKQVAINTLAQAIRDIASLSNSTDRGPG